MIKKRKNRNCVFLESQKTAKMGICHIWTKPDNSVTRYVKSEVKRLLPLRSEMQITSPTKVGGNQN
ncbi:MAG: hypothetical protein LBB06_01315 [Endomicrobium sp.]|nr:hypothetical protein [Endomicrobium sp.]